VTARGTWKAFELRTARDHGTERTPVSGRQSDAGAPDWESPLFVAQVKLGRRQPSYLRDWLAGIARQGERLGKVPLVIWKPLYARDEEALVLVRYRDWVALHGTTRSEP
jgi:hypothetical protein